MLGPFDLPGPAFLQLYLILLLIAVIAGLMIPPWLRPEGRDTPITQADDLAYLAGGSNRFAETVTTRMLTGGALRIDSKAKFSRGGVGVVPGSPDSSVLALGEGPRWSDISRMLTAEASTVEERLVNANLLMNQSTAFQMRLWQTLPYLLLLVFGTIKLQIGVARDKPVGLLTALLVVTTVLAIIRFAALDRRTRSGNRVLAKARETSDRIRRAPTNDEAALGVALFGTAILAGSDWEPLHRMRAASGGDGSSSGGCGSSDGGSGGGGCGGGGCGGCGGS